ncbi:mycothiol synthase [Nakamurella panacisegetis]|uniref:Mycothiol acetyltransferase n=1 Tax=Nakamurella panacisegetis TaxID=1090615 RepID=A0A1H0JMK8_9ACTN|nr:mycothiol synthase [Nakamurella panacisegetis]SDO44621.1 mycothiol synthase [Nakamurella panacisegetis]
MSWIHGLPAATVDAVRVAAGAAEVADGIAPLSGHVLEALGSDQYILATRSGTQVLGLAVSHDDDPVELFVTPEHRRQGLGTELLHAALDRAGAVWAHGDLAPARALAARLGLVRSRELLQMRRPLSRSWAAAQVAASALPAGVRLRTFVPGRDEEQFLGVNARAFDWHPEQGRLDLAGLRAEMAQEWFDPDGFFLAVDEHDTVLGFHWTKVHRDGAVPLGEIYVLGVDPAAVRNGERVRGLGTPLTAAGLAYLAERSATAMLYVEGDNLPARNLYRRLGFEVFTTDVVYRRAAAT